jgi:cell wall assembly regulator SMI1
MQNFINTGETLTISDIREVEKNINITFPTDLVNLYLQYNGGEIDGNRYFYVDDYNDIDVSIKTFMPMKYKRNKNDVLLEEYYRLFAIEKTLIPLSHIPFAIDDGGYPYSINANDNKIYIGYIEDYDGTPESTTRFIANSLTEFIDGIKTEKEAYK